MMLLMSFFCKFDASFLYFLFSIITRVLYKFMSLIIGSFTAVTFCFLLMRINAIAYEVMDHVFRLHRYDAK